MSEARWIRATCENGHGQSIVFELPPPEVSAVGGVAVHLPGAAPEVSLISSRLGTHPVYIGTDHPMPEIFAELMNLASEPCGFCGGAVIYQPREGEPEL